MTSLSITAAAAECGDAPAVITRDRVITFREAAQAPLPGPAITATSAVDTLLAIYAALEARKPLALLHARLTDEERARQRAGMNIHSVPEDTAFVLFTSGSTGKARGVVLSRDAITAAAEAHAARFGWREDDRWLACLPLAHTGGLAIAIRCLVARRPVVLHEGDFDAAEVAELAIARRATLASFVPAQLVALADRLAGASLRLVLLGGAAAPPALLERARALPVHTTYGLTETFGQVATARAPGERPAALPGVELVAGTREQPARIRVRGATLATRYLDGTPIAPELETADLGYLEPDGGLVVCGRVDDVIISGGENVHPAEVEAVLAATPGVRAACAFGLPDPRWGQLVGAALVTDATFDRAAADARWRVLLPPHARPRRLAIVRELPMLPSGKVDRRGAAALAGTSDALHPRA